MPPRIIKSASIVIIIPVIVTGTLKVDSSAVEIEFACVRFPMPNDAITANNAKNHPSTAPSFLCLKAFFRVFFYAFSFFYAHIFGFRLINKIH